MPMRPDRRKFIKDSVCAALGGASVYSAIGQMSLLQAATQLTSATYSDYKALICVFLYGGNDSFNTVVPISGAARTAYDKTRPTGNGLIGLAPNTLHALSAPASGAGSPGDSSVYGLHPSMTELATLFNGGHAAIVANVGTLVRPTQRTTGQYLPDSAPLPPQLFSHSDQTAYWQSSPPTNQPVTGWGGRIADLVTSANPAGLPILTGLGGQDAFTRGVNVNGYVMNSYSASSLGFLNGNSGAVTCANPGGAYDSGAATVFCNLQKAGAQANVLERTFANTMNHSINTSGVINTALIKARPAGNGGDYAGDPKNSIFKTFFPNPTGYDLDSQLQAVAELIWAANLGNVPGYTGLKRQVFFVSTGGYDTHSDEINSHTDILPLLSKSLAGFYNALASKGLGSAATAFTCSDFGRTMTANNGGTDHGWGSHHFVVGGAVAGKKFYGNGCSFQPAANYGTIMPSLVNPTTDWGTPSPNLNDSGDGYGRVIPTTSVDQYAATLASWFLTTPGYNPASDINLIFPNLANFSTKTLGFV
jgi:uncharacterized protein (DUF1501 family)